MTNRNVLLVELNEVTWDLIDPLIEQGKLPTFARLKREGVWGSPVSVDLPPDLNPWVTWTTVYTGRSREAHNVTFLQQPPETITAQRIWELAAERGVKVGVYGSLCSWPPRAVDGFYVPDTFAPDPSTYPERLRPIQELNLTYTRSVRLETEQDGLLFKARLGKKLLGLGLKPGTISRITRQLAAERVKPELRWRRVALQPIVNFDFFSRLYRQYRPGLATFHTNHVAHYMHTYWRAMRPDIFPQQTAADEVQTFGGAIEHGYRVADELLSKMLGLLDDKTILVVASSMGQKPFISRLEKGKRVFQVRSLDRLLAILGVEGQARALATMSDEFVIYAETTELRDKIMGALKTAYVDAPDRPLFSTQTVENSITVTLSHYDETHADSLCYFPRGQRSEPVRFDDLIYSSGESKSGCHDPKGVLLVYGPGVARGARLGDCNNLDIAPTLLRLLGLQAPEELRGRVLEEAMPARTALAAAR